MSEYLCDAALSISPCLNVSFCLTSGLRYGNTSSGMYTFELYYDNGYLKATIKNGSTTVYSYEGDVSNVISFDKFYPVIMVYDYGGAMLFNNVIIEPWSR